MVQGLVHRRLLIRVERIDGAHQNFERITRKRFAWNSAKADGFRENGLARAK